MPWACIQAGLAHKPLMRADVVTSSTAARFTFGMIHRSGLESRKELIEPPRDGSEAS